MFKLGSKNTVNFTFSHLYVTFFFNFQIWNNFSSDIGDYSKLQNSIYPFL